MLDEMDRLATLTALAALARGGNNIRPVFDKKLNEDFTHIKDLKEGEALRLAKTSNLKFPKNGDTVIVYRVLDDIIVDGLDKGSPVKRYDFTALMLDTGDGGLLEYSFDSRYFERVTE